MFIQSQVPSKSIHIILVHGLFMPSTVMLYLRNFFQNLGYATTIFSYKTTSESSECNAQQLKNFVEATKGQTIIVCHSLGGLITQQMLSMMDVPEEKVQKVISIGTPWQGASIVPALQKYYVDSIIGKSRDILLPKDIYNEWKFSNIPLGSIAGYSTFGARMLLASQENEESDGTVTINETKIKGMTDHTIIPISHTALIFSNLCAQKALRFIESNHF